MNQVGVPAPLYKAREKVYPKAVVGRFRRLKWAVMGVCFAFFYLMPFVRWDRGPNTPDQAILIDLAGRRVYLFGLEFWPQEVYFVTGVMILAAILLFMVSALFGRVWCGYACPQTVWTDLFVMVERWIEGDRMARIRLDQAGWSAVKMFKKLAKHGVWLGISVASGCAFVGWYSDAPSLTLRLLHFQASSIDYGFIALLTTTTYLLGGWAREQVCTYMCPWPRIQAAMEDEHSRVVTYQAWRGEPRGKATETGIGDCVDCHACVQVCPTGIDIRDGHQLECIDCSLCVDACDAIMARLGRPTGLIAWDSFTGQKQRAAGQPAEWRPVRPRTIIYACVLLGVSAVMLIGILMRTPLSMDVLHDRNPLFVTGSGGTLRNGYTIKISNKTRRPHEFALYAEGIGGARLAIAGETDQLAGRAPKLVVRPDGQTSYHITATIPAALATSPSMPITFALIGRDGDTIRLDDHFFTPAGRAK